MGQLRKQSARGAGFPPHWHRLNTGLAIVGNIGSKQRMEFTAIGDSINLAARLEQATRNGGVDILVSEYTYVATRSRFRFEPAGEISLKGKTESARTYTIRKLP